MDFGVCFKQVLPLITSGNNTFQGSAVDLMHFLSKSYNFSFTAVTSLDWAQDLGSERCEISVGLDAFYMAIPGMCPSAPFHFTDVYLLSRIVNQHTKLTTSFSINYSMQHALYGLTFAVCLLALFTYFGERIVSNIRKSKNSPSNLTFWNFLWMYFGNVFCEPCQYSLKSLSSKILFMFWMFSLIVILSSIGGNMKADLATSKDSLINSIQDVIDRPKLHPFIHPSSGLQGYFAMHSDQLFKELTKRSLEWNKGTFLDVTEGRSVLLVDELHINHFLTFVNTERFDGYDKLHLSPPILQYPSVIFFSCEIENEMQELFNRRILYFAATKQFTPALRLPQIRVARGRATSGKDQLDLFFLIYVWSIGMMIAATILVAENALYLFKTTKIRKKIKYSRRYNYVRCCNRS